MDPVSAGEIRHGAGGGGTNSSAAMSIGKVAWNQTGGEEREVCVEMFSRSKNISFHANPL